MNQVYLLTGGNMGNRSAVMADAIDRIAQKVGQVKASSALYETMAWGINDQPAFLNQVLLVHTSLSATQILETILEIEHEMGRKRMERYGPRIIDIDILLFNHEVINLPQLTVPHPFLHQRRFTLVPLAELAAEYTHPVLHQTIEELLANCIDTLDVKKYSR
ncbi:MAG TPA: 2-amino-4-hydroxy-6-hydroxymethyldihydropteridine diphosphokinase [Phnomibacter sp.]|nr:2-amino-4-hydroxy-6-hydroxymethyldihydropteridine diphosphokinase [Phnomibacter sp.]